MSTLNEIGRCHTNYGYVVIGSYSKFNVFDNIVVEFHRTDGCSEPFTLEQIVAIMERALDYDNYYIHNDVISRPSFYSPYLLFPLMQLQAQLFQQDYQ